MAVRTAPARASADPLMLVSDIVNDMARKEALDALERRHRTDKRYPLSAAVPLSVSYVPGGPFTPELQAWGLDISYTGIGLLTERELEPASPVYLDLAALGRPHSVVEMRVLYCSHMVGQIHRVGAVFVFE